MKDLLAWFGLKAFPFDKNLKTHHVFETGPFKEAMARFDYIKRRGGILLLTGTLAVGKTLALRRYIDTLNENLFKPYYIPLFPLSRADLLYHLNRLLGLLPRRSKSTVYGQIQKPLLESKESSGKALPLIMDGVHLMRIEVFAQLHTLLQFDLDSKPLVSLIRCGQNTLLDKLVYHSSKALASRFFGRSYLKGLTLRTLKSPLEDRGSLRTALCRGSYPGHSAGIKRPASKGEPPRQRGHGRGPGMTTHWVTGLLYSLVPFPAPFIF